VIDCGAFVHGLKDRGISLFCGVPDSLLSSLCSYVEDHASAGSHWVVANEGNAIALAMGHHLATGGTAAVYLQNSGLGNAVNPITSLADREVYRVPLLMIIGWRGEPGVKDEPQHVKQGRITLPQLKLLEIPHWVLDADSDMAAVLDEAFATMRSTGAPVALVVRKDSFSAYTRRTEPPAMSDMGREEALGELMSLAGADDLLITTTGKTSREVYELRGMRGQAQHDFLTVGGMGHASSIALGAALGAPDRRVICLDGDGAALMHLGAMAVIGSVSPPRLVHVLLNNGAHESVGGQATVAPTVDFCAVARAVGYPMALLADDLTSLRQAWAQAAVAKGPVMLEVRIRCGSRDNLGRPKSSAEDNKNAFMEHARGH